MGSGVIPGPEKVAEDLKLLEQNYLEFLSHTHALLWERMESPSCMHTHVKGEIEALI